MKNSNPGKYIWKNGDVVIRKAKKIHPKSNLTRLAERKSQESDRK